MFECLLSSGIVRTKNPVTPLPDPTVANLAGQATTMFPSTDGQYIYILGGYGEGSTASRTLLRYGIATKTWVRLADCPRTWNNGVLNFAPANEVNGEIIGWLGTETSRYNIANNTWVSTKNLPAAGSWDLSMGRAVVRNNKLISFGYGSTYSQGSKIVQFDPVTSVYSTVSVYQPVSKLWSYPATAIIGDKLYLGGDGNQLTRYDFTTNTWSAITIPLGAYNNFNFCVLKGKLYMVGAGPANKNVWSYDPANDAFKNELPLTLAVSSSNTAVAGPDAIYCLINVPVGNVYKAKFFSYTP